MLIMKLAVKSINFVPSPLSSPFHPVFNLVLPALLRVDIVITS